jgi:hypothetical protein
MNIIYKQNWNFINQNKNYKNIMLIILNILLNDMIKTHCMIININHNRLIIIMNKV